MVKYPEKFRGKKILSFYSYYGPDGALSAIVGRTADKEFPVYHLGPNRHWVNRKPATNFPYRLPELLQAGLGAIVFIVEGEKDCDTLHKFGFIATSNMGGSNASRAFQDWSQYFSGRRLFIIPDNDAPGEKHAAAVYEILREVAASIHIIRLPGVREKGDVTDWLMTEDGSPERLQLLCKEAEELAREVPPLQPAMQTDDTFVMGDAYEGVDQLEDDEKYDASWKPFPVNLLPIEQAEYINEVGRMLSCDPAYVVLSSIVTMGTGIGNSRVCVLNEEWTEPSVFWGCLIAEGSTTKSPAGDKGAWPLLELHSDFVKANNEAQQVYDEEMKIFKLNGHAKEPGKKDEAPLKIPELEKFRRVKVKDITVEKLAEVMYDNPKGIALVTDELASWFGSFTRYKSAGIAGTDMPFWLEVIRAGTHDVDRKGGNRPSIHIQRAGCSVYGNTQRETLANLVSNDFFSSGFVARILFAMPPKNRKVFIRGGIDAGVKHRYRETFRKLYFIEGEGTHELERQGRPVQFTPKGMDAWEDFYKLWADRQYVSFGKIGAALSKLEAYCARFAMMFAMIDYVNARIPCEEIGPDHVERAFEVVKWFSEEANRVYMMIETPLAELELQRLIGYIATYETGITKRDLFLSNPQKYKSSAKAEGRLEELLAAGLVRVENMPTAAGGGRAKKVYFSVQL